MATVSYKEYNELKLNFVEKHNHDFEVETSPMNEYGVYHKTYAFADGAVWYETMSPVYEDYEVEVKGVKVKGSVKLLRTEFWSTEEGSKYYYEKF